MPQYLEFLHVFRETWANVTLAFWKKYPNELSRHVLSVDTIHRSIDPETKCMSSTRIMTKTNRKPQWMQWWTPAGSVLIVEESVLDPAAKTLTTYTKNITLVPYMQVEEKCVFSVSPENPDWTICRTEARVTSELIIRSLVETFGQRRFHSNVVSAKTSIQYILDNEFAKPL